MFLDMLSLVLRMQPNLTVVATARTAYEGVEACVLHRPDVLILDLELPDESGLLVARLLKRAKPSAKVIILSALAKAFECPPDLKDVVYAAVDKSQGIESLEQEVAQLLMPSWRRDHHGIDPEEVLSRREREIFLLMGRGLTTKEIASTLSVSPHTVQAHRKNIAARLGTVGAELTQRALQHGQRVKLTTERKPASG